MPKIGKKQFQYGSKWLETDVMYTTERGFYIKDPFLAETMKMYMNEVPNLAGHTSEVALYQDIRRAIESRRKTEEQSRRVLVIYFQSSGRLYWEQTSENSHQGSGKVRGEALSPGTAGMVLSWDSYFVKEWEGKTTYYSDNEGVIGYASGHSDVDVYFRCSDIAASMDRADFEGYGRVRIAAARVQAAFPEEKLIPAKTQQYQYMYSSRRVGQIKKNGVTFDFHLIPTAMTMDKLFDTFDLSLSQVALKYTGISDSMYLDVSKAFAHTRATGELFVYKGMLRSARADKAQYDLTLKRLERYKLRFGKLIQIVTTIDHATKEIL